MVYKEDKLELCVEITQSVLACEHSVWREGVWLEREMWYVLMCHMQRGQTFSGLSSL